MKSTIKVLLSLTFGMMLISNTIHADESFTVDKLIKAESITTAQNELYIDGAILGASAGTEAEKESWFKLTAPSGEYSVKEPLLNLKFKVEYKNAPSPPNNYKYYYTVDIGYKVGGVKKQISWLTSITDVESGTLTLDDRETRRESPQIKGEYTSYVEFERWEVPDDNPKGMKIVHLGTKEGKITIK